jgi:hypothetical protein
LKVEDILQITVISISPEVRAAFGLEQLRGDANSVSGLTNAAFQDLSHAKFASYLAHVNRLALVYEARIARDHEQPLDPR